MEFSILGALEVRRDGRPVVIAGAKLRALLALLVLHANEPVTAERLAIGLWGEDAPAAAVKTIHVYVSRLRATLAEEDLLVTGGAGYLLRIAPEAIDAVRFERLYGAGLDALRAGDAQTAATRLREALALWRGPALADFAGEAFAQPEIALLEEQRLAATEARVDADLEAGRHRELVAELRQRVADQPLRETGYRQLMLALSRSGRRADALAVYRQAHRALADGLGLEPSAELRELERRILAQEEEPPVEPGAARIPRPPTPTVGRDADLARLGELLARHSLITIVGPGGVGKTRLAVEAARAGAAAFAGGADFVSLAAASAADEVAAAIVRQLAIALTPGESLEGALVRHVERRELLLVLDNFEQVLEAAGLVARLLESCPRLTLVVTSREPLRLRSERIFRLEPLTLRAAVEQFTTLVEARDHAVTGSDAAAADEICRRLDGLPLAIELAAGRIGLLSVDGLAARLRGGLDALGAGARDAPARQRTLTATIAWSFDLATAEEQAAVAALAVFAGGCTLDAAEVVTETPLEVLDALVTKNLVVAREGRLTLLETIREFALSRVADADTVRRRHCEYFLGMAEDAGAELERSGSPALLARHDAEVDNFRAALGWALDRGAAEVALRLATALHPYWKTRELRVDAARWLEAALALDGERVPVSVRARALNAYSEQVASVSGLERAEHAARESLAICEPADRAAGLCALAFVRLRLHRVAEAYALASEAEGLAVDAQTRLNAIEIKAMMAPTLGEALALAEEAVTAHRAAGHLRKVGRLLGSLAYTALYLDEPETAATLCAEALEVTSPVTDPFVVVLAEGNAGLAALFTGDVTGAAAAFTRQLRLGERHGYDNVLFEGLSGLAALAAIGGRDALAARLSGAAEVSSDDWHDPVIAARLEERFFAGARARLGVPAWEAEHAVGARLDRAAALEAAYAVAG